MSETLQVTKEGHIAILQLNRPKVFNSFDKEMGKALIEALDDCAIDENVRAILLTGTGKAFCAGQDLGEVTNPEVHPGFQALLEQRYKPILLRLRNIEKPIVCAVNGVAAGAGANIALACDIVIAKESAKFIQAFSAIGLIPDSAGTYTLPRLIGFQKASALMMLGDKIGAKEAEAMGMIYKAVPDDEFEETANKLVTRLSKMPTKGLALTKRALNASLENTFEEQLDLETLLQVQASETQDYHEGVQAFIEKRKPNFIGK